MLHQYSTARLGGWHTVTTSIGGPQYSKQEQWAWDEEYA